MINSDSIRAQFPSLSRVENDNQVVYLDGPGGTQVPERVTQAMIDYYSKSNSNTHGFFPASVETDEVLDTTRGAIADLLNAEGPSSISIGQNMTSLAFSLSRAFYRVFQPGDEVIITQLDHEANRGPWLTLRQKGVVVREVRLLPTGELDYEDLKQKMNDRTRLVAVGWASNALGTINDLKLVRKLCYESNALMLVDAVHYAPHFSIDVQNLGCDFLLCSSYKYYGPHLGFLYSKPGALDQLPVDRLITAGQAAPYSIETGTLNHAALAGARASVDFLASFGEGSTRREKLIDAYTKIGQHENNLAQKLYEGLNNIDGIQVVGLDFDREERAPTLSFTHNRFTAEEICTVLGSKMICAWDGHFYAIRAIEVLGLLESGGVTRMGISIYNTESEIDRTLSELAKL